MKAYTIDLLKKSKFYNNFNKQIEKKAKKIKIVFF